MPLLFELEMGDLRPWDIILSLFWDINQVKI